MTQRATTAFDDFYTVFSAPTGETLPLTNGNHDILVEMVYPLRGKPYMTFRFYGDMREYIPHISIQTHNFKPCLHTRVNRRHVRAESWCELAQRLEELDVPEVFPRELRILMMQAGGDEAYRDAFRLNM